VRGLNSSPPASMYFRAMARWACQLAAAASFPAACAGPLAGRAAAGALGRRGMRAPGGAFLAYAVADLLGVAFLAGHRWPGETGRYHLPAVRGGIDDWRVGVVDDAVNAGTAVVACLEELRACACPSTRPARYRAGHGLPNDARCAPKGPRAPTLCPGTSSPRYLAEGRWEQAHPAFEAEMLTFPRKHLVRALT